eukprot:gene17546-12554_t
MQTTGPDDQCVRSSLSAVTRTSPSVIVEGFHNSIPSMINDTWHDMALVHPHPSERPLDYYERLEASVKELVASAKANTAAVTKGMSNVQRLFRLTDIGASEIYVTCALHDVLFRIQDFAGLLSCVWYWADKPFFSLESILQLPQKLAVAVCKLGDSIEALANCLNKLLALTTIEPKEAWRVRLRRLLQQLRRESKEFVVDIGLLVL